MLRRLLGKVDDGRFVRALAGMQAGWQWDCKERNAERVEGFVKYGSKKYMVVIERRGRGGSARCGCDDAVKRGVLAMANDARTPRQRRMPGAHTYQLLRREISPRSDLFGAGVVAVDLFTNWVEDESLFEESWEQVLPLSQPFKIFIRKLLSRDGFASAAEALACLC